MSSIVKAVFALVLTLACVHAAEAATIYIVYDEKADTIVVDGEIEDNDDVSFLAVANATSDKIDKDAAKDRRVEVYLNSQGGSLMTALVIGEIIHKRKFNTYVSDDSECFSACALVWMAGKARFFSNKSSIGFHAACEVNNKACLESGAANALTGAYLGKLGFSNKAIVFATIESPRRILMLSQALSDKFGIGGSLISKIDFSVAEKTDRHAIEWSEDFSGHGKSDSGDDGDENDPDAFTGAKERHEKFMSGIPLDVQPLDVEAMKSK